MKHVKIGLAFLLLALSFFSCMDKIPSFHKVEELNHDILDSASIWSPACDLNINLLACDSAPLEVIQKANLFSISEVKVYLGKNKGSCIAYRTMTPNAIRYDYVYFVFVENPSTMSTFRSYEQFRDGLVGSTKIDENWFYCEITEDI
ncbi:MAG: hypothetical protein AAF399_09070 [Bacteroidota bacterium]